MELNILKALGDEKKFTILLLLMSSNLCAQSLSKKLAISESAVSLHLKTLKELQLIIGEKKGYYVHYKFNKEKLLPVIELLRSLYDEDQKKIELLLNKIDLSDCKTKECKKDSCCNQ